MVWLKGYSHEKLKFPHYLVTPMPMEGEERFWNPQNRDGVPWEFQGDQKHFIMGVYGVQLSNVLKTWKEPMFKSTKMHSNDIVAIN